ncbi:hypothetical protein NQ315_017525 [Exocentrus adspersus]|uniref:Uncharacterized protein n=1 Tax=Exocentrus adspersus TaxID=1586481 RepID=A0AAV8VJU7_9CUCU|nr:hypothetical protein NQ315_017525 [Exocentrus adspersus]
MADAAIINLNEINEMISADLELHELKPLTKLAVGKPYTIKTFTITNTRFGKTILALLFDVSEGVTFKSFLPQRVLKAFTEDVVTSINMSQEKYTLTYLGQSKPSVASIKPSYWSKLVHLLPLLLPISPYLLNQINMSNTSSNWLGSEELDLMVDALSVQLYYLANEERLTGVLEEDEEVHCPHAECSEYCISKMENYLLGGNLCRQYLFGVLNLEEFCQAMVNADLKKYLFEISNYLPGSVRNKFGLYETSDYGSDGSDGEGQS